LDNTTSVSTWPSIFQNIVIGNDRGMTARSFNGLIDGMVLYNYVRTPAQIAWDYNRGKPVGWWKLDEGEGISAYDSSGNGNTGTLTNLDPSNDWVDGKFGKALDFDGSDDYVETSASTIFDVGTTVSMTAWIKRDTNSHNWESIANHIKKTSSYDGYWIGSIANGKIRAFVGPYTNYVDTTNAVSNSVWHHVALVSNGTIFSIYVDGVKASADQAVGAISTTNVSVRIGRSIAAGEYFDGQIDDVRIYNYALTAEQIKQIMNEGSAIRFGE
jgi:hypothetical protein